MRDFLNLSLRLLVLALVAGLLLGVTNAITAGPIAEQEAKAANSSRQTLFKNADNFKLLEDVDLANYPDVTEVYGAYSGADTLGYALSLAPQGYKGIINLTVGVGTNGALKGVIVNSQSETAGLGSKVADEPFLNQFTGVASDAADISSNVDGIAGATVSSRAVVNAVGAAAELVKTEFAIVPQEAKPLFEDDKPRLNTMPGADGFEYVDMLSFLGEYSSIQQVKGAYKGPDLIGYSFTLSAEGFGGAIPIIMGIDTVTQQITGITIGENGESEGYGARINDADYQAQYAGLALDTAALDNVENIEGAGMTSSAVKGAVAQAINFYHDYLEEKPLDDGLDDADSFEDVAIPEEYTRIMSVQAAQKSGATIGYRIEAQDSSYTDTDPIRLAVSIRDGSYASIAVISSNETATGNAALAKDYLDSFIGKAANVATFDGLSVDAITSSSVNNTAPAEAAAAPTDAAGTESAEAGGAPNAAGAAADATDANSGASNASPAEDAGKVDVISGATNTSNAVIRILRECAQLVSAVQ